MQELGPPPGKLRGVNCLNILVNKEYLDELVINAQENISFISAAVNLLVPGDELAGLINQKLNEILYYIKRAYNPELVELKRQARAYYQKWLCLKDTDKNTAEAVYLEYMKLKCKIKLEEIPF